MCDSCKFKVIFGKHEGQTLEEIANRSSQWLFWVRENFDRGPVLTAVEEYLEQHEAELEEE